MLARMTTVRTLDAKAAQKLVEQLIAVPVNDGGEYCGRDRALAARRAARGDPARRNQRARRAQRDVGRRLGRGRGRARV